MEVRVAGLTFNVPAPEIPSKVAVMVAEPTATAFAIPAAVTVATAVAEDDQVTTEVKSKDAPSEYVAVAVSCCPRPWITLGFTGAIAIDEMVADVTVSASLDDMLPDVALMTDVPAAKPRVSPVASTEATSPEDEDQVTEDVMS